jgi:hypothetical protein
MSAFALLQRVQEGHPELDECGHSPDAMLNHFKREGKFMLFMAITLVTVLLLQNAITKLLDAVVVYIFPHSAIKGSILQLVWALVIVPIVITLGAF